MPIRVTGPEGAMRWHALVDTGADETLLPLSLAKQLGIELDDEATSLASGISGDELTIRYGEVEFDLSDGTETVKWKTMVGFVDFGAGDDEVIVLGHGGCLDYFTASFDGQHAELEMSANSLLPTS